MGCRIARTMLCRVTNDPCSAKKEGSCAAKQATTPRIWIMRIWRWYIVVCMAKVLSCSSTHWQLLCMTHADMTQLGIEADMNSCQSHVKCRDASRSRLPGSDQYANNGCPEGQDNPLARTAATQKNIQLASDSLNPYHLSCHVCQSCLIKALNVLPERAFLLLALA